MKLGDMSREDWSYERLCAEGWVYAGAFAGQYRAAGFRLRSLSVAVYAPAWLGKLDLYRWGTYPAGHCDRLPALQRVAARVQEHGDEDLAAAFALGGGKAVNNLLKAEGIL